MHKQNTKKQSKPNQNTETWTQDKQNTQQNKKTHTATQ